ncbi:MAG: hypothetical protein ABTQ34_04760 [Bdellovibrionales bacterium]
MSIDEDYGYCPQDISAAYYGLEERDGHVFAVVGGTANGNQLIARNDLAATISMMLFEFELHECPALDAQTEIKPLIDLVFASLERGQTFSGVVAPDHISRQELFNLHFDEVPEVKALSEEGKTIIQGLIKQHPSLWPQGSLDVAAVHNRSTLQTHSTCPSNTPAPR